MSNDDLMSAEAHFPECKGCKQKIAPKNITVEGYCFNCQRAVTQPGPEVVPEVIDELPVEKLPGILEEPLLKNNQEWSSQARKMFTRLNLITYGNLCELTADELLACKNFGQSSLDHVRHQLAIRGLHLEGEEELPTSVTPINKHEGKKYLRLIHSAHPENTREPISVDVYAVLKAFDVTCPATAHAVKKLLCAGQRGKGSRHADLIGAIAAINRAIDLDKQEERKHD